MENTNQPNTTSENNSSIKELMTILKDGEIKNSILSLKTFQGMEIGKDKETQTPVISLYGTKKEETEDNQEEESQGNQGNNEESNEGKENPVDPQSNNESNEGEIIEEVLKLLGIDLPNHLREATKKPMPVIKLSVPYNNLNEIFIDQVQNYLKANKLAVNAVKGDSDGKFIVMFSNKNIENKFLSDFIKDVEEYKGYTSMDAKNINVARSLTNTEIKQIVDMLNKNLPLISQKIMSEATFKNTFKNILGKYTFQFSIDSFIKKDKNTISESAIKNFAKLQEDSQTLKVEPPFEKWTSGDVKEAPKQKKVSTLPVELEVKVIATPIEQKVNPEQEPKVKDAETSTEKQENPEQEPKVKDAETSTEKQENPVQGTEGNNVETPIEQKVNAEQGTEGNNVETPIEQKVNAEQGTEVKNITESILRSLGITMPEHLREETGLQPKDNQEGKEIQPQSTNTRVLTLDYLKVLRDCFVKSAQKQNFSIRTKENSQLINGLPVVFGNGKDKYLKVSKDGISGLFTIQAALGEQNALTKVANWAYKNKNAFKSPQDTSSVVL